MTSLTFPFFISVAIRYGRMPEAEKRKLVAGLLAGETSVQNPGGSDLKSLAKHVYNAYLKNLNMTKKKARSILTGRTSTNPVPAPLLPALHCNRLPLAALVFLKNIPLCIKT